MISLDSGDKIQGDGSTAAKIDYTISGLDANAIKQLADGQLADAIGDMFTADSADVVSTITLVNTHTSALTCNLYLTPSGGTARRLIPKDLSLGIGYSLHTDGKEVVIMSPAGGVQSAYAAHASSHNSGGADPITTLGAITLAGAVTGGSQNVAGLGTVGCGALTTTGTTTIDTGTTGIIRADSGVLSVDADVTAEVAAATDSAAGKVELALASEVNTGTSTALAVTPDALAGSIHGRKTVYIKVLANDTALETGDGKAYVTIPDSLSGMNLVDADAAVYTVSSSGTPTIQIHNLTDAVDMLSTLITIDASEFSSYTAATPPVIDGAADDVVTGDRIRIDVDVAGTDTTGLDVILTFATP